MSTTLRPAHIANVPALPLPESFHVETPTSSPFVCGRCGKPAVARLCHLDEGDALFCNACLIAGTGLLAEALRSGTDGARWGHPEDVPAAPAEVYIQQLERLTRWLFFGLIVPLVALLVVRNLPGLRDLPWWP